MYFQLQSHLNRLQAECAQRRRHRACASVIGYKVRIEHKPLSKGPASSPFTISAGLRKGTSKAILIFLCVKLPCNTLSVKGMYNGCIEERYVTDSYICLSSWPPHIPPITHFLPPPSLFVYMYVCVSDWQFVCLPDRLSVPRSLHVSSRMAECPFADQQNDMDFVHADFAGAWFV